MPFVRMIDFFTYFILSYNIERVHQLRNSYPPVNRRKKKHKFSNMTEQKISIITNKQVIPEKCIFQGNVSCNKP